MELNEYVCSESQWFLKRSQTSKQGERIFKSGVPGGRELKKIADGDCKIIP